MYFKGLLIGAITFLIIGFCHPLVIKAEYYLTKKSWYLFLIFGLFFSILSIFIANLFISAIVAALGFSLLWGIGEVIEQENRVLKNWFPENPKRHDYYEALRKKKGLIK